jgi:hypothetical protein
MGAKTISTEAPKISNIALQTSAYGGVLPLIYGTTRVSGNLIWYGAFTPIATTTSTSSGGKGLGKVTSKNTTYTYTAAVMLALGEGSIVGIGAVWKGKDKTTLAALGLTLFTGALGQAAWSYRTGYDPVSANIAYENAYGFYGQTAYTPQTIAYSGTAYLAASAYDLGGDASVPNHGFEVQAKAIYGSGIVDANPKDIVSDFLSNPVYGSGFPSALLGSLTQYDAYCRAIGLFFSPAYTEQRAAADHMKELTDASNTALVWSEGVLKFIPYGDTAATGNGATFTPDTTPVYNLTDNDFLEEVRVSRQANSDAFNRMQVEYLDRSNQYNTALVTVEDQAAIERFGLRPAQVMQAHMICDPAVAKLVAQMALQKNLYKRNVYSFMLPANFALLEPMDIVTLTTGDMVAVPVRITQIEESDDDFALTAEDFPLGVAQAPRYSHDSGRSYQATPNQTPASVNAPAFFELPPDANSITGLALAVAVGGQTTDLIYGGCRVWASLDGTTYKEVGVIYGHSRYGTLTSAYAAASGLDTTNTLAVLLASTGQLLSGSADDALNASTLLAVDREFMSYTTATLTGTRAYNLTSIQRGQYGTTGAAHASGASWARIDDAICRLPNLDLTLIGTLVYFKFTAFNTFGSGEQDLSAATAYSYRPTGYAQELGKYASVATGATNNALVEMSSAPSSPVLGQIWKDTGVSPNVLKMWNGGAWARLANDTVPGITATASVGGVSGSAFLGSQPGNITTGSVTITPAGGATYSYAWGLVSGTTFTVNSPTGATTTFTKSCRFADQFSAVYRCTITSLTGATAGATTSVDITVDVTETH